MKFKIKYADQVVGAFVLVAIAFTALIFVAVGSRQRWFARDFVYNSRFPSGAGLSTGTAIQFRGFQIGTIQKVTLNDRNEAEVRLVIFNQYKDRVRQNSLLEMVVSPIGLGNQLLFHAGKSEEVLPAGSFIPSYDLAEGRKLVEAGLVDRPPKDDTISRLISNVNPLLENVNEAVVQAGLILRGVNGADGARIDGLMGSVERTVPQALASIAALAQDLELAMANLRKLSEGLGDAEGLVPRLLGEEGSIGALFHDGNQLYRRLDASLAGVEGTLSNLSGATSVLNNQMPRLAATIEEARNAIIRAQEVMEGLKNNPLLRGGIQDKVEPQAAPTSLRDTDF